MTLLALPTMNELDKLTDKQRRFVDEYCIDFNGTAAARRAGYEYKIAGTLAMNLKMNGDVAKAIDRRRSLLGLKTEITKESIIEQLRKLAYADLRNVVSWGNPSNPYGVALVASDTLTDEAAACVSEVARTKDGIKIKTHDKAAAVAQLSKMLGYDAPTRLELSGVNGEAIRTVSESMTPEQAAEAYRMTRDA